MNTDLKYIDSLYAEMLEVGFMTLREAALLGELDWVKAEIELLHNAPSLIGELNWARHDYFIEKEREAYVAWVSQSAHENAGSRMRTFYEPLWSQLEVLIKSKRRE